MTASNKLWQKINMENNYQKELFRGQMAYIWADFSLKVKFIHLSMIKI